jgi:hypothetical protein
MIRIIVSIQCKLNMLFDLKTTVAKLNTPILVNVELASHLPMTGLIHYYCLTTGRTELTDKDFQLLQNTTLRYPLAWFRYWFNLYKSSSLFGKSEKQIWDESHQWENKSSSFELKLQPVAVCSIASYFSSRLESTRKVTVHVGILRKLKQAANLYYYLRWANPTGSGRVEYTHADINKEFKVSPRTIRRWHSKLVECGAINKDESECLDYATGHYRVQLGSIKKVWYNLSKGSEKTWGASARLSFSKLKEWGTTKAAVVIETQHLQQASERQAKRSLLLEGKKHQVKVILAPEELVNGNAKPSQNNLASLDSLVDRKIITEEERLLGGKRLFHQISKSRVWISDRLVAYGGSQSRIKSEQWLRDSKTIRKHLNKLDRKQVFQETNISNSLLEHARYLKLETVDGVSLKQLHYNRSLGKVFKACPNIYNFTKHEVELTSMRAIKGDYLAYRDSITQSQKSQIKM